MILIVITIILIYGSKLASKIFLFVIALIILIGGKIIDKMVPSKAEKGD